MILNKNAETKIQSLKKCLTRWHTNTLWQATLKFKFLCRNMFKYQPN